MDLQELRVFVAVARERSFSRAASELHRSQPAVSQTVRRLEEEFGETLIDRSTKTGTLTPLGQVLLGFADRMLRLADEAESSIREMRALQRGRVSVGVNEGAVHMLLPLIEAFRAAHGAVMLDVRRVAARQVAREVADGHLDFGVMTFEPLERRLSSVILGSDELVVLVPPTHRLAGRGSVTLAEFGAQTVIAHSDPSPARERVLQVSERRHVPINIEIALPSLEAIKRAVELNLGVALLPRRCALSELTKGTLVALAVPEVRLPRHVRLVYREHNLSPAAQAFLDVASAPTGRTPRRVPVSSRRTRRKGIGRQPPNAVR